MSATQPANKSEKAIPELTNDNQPQSVAIPDTYDYIANQQGFDEKRFNDIRVIVGMNMYNTPHLIVPSILNYAVQRSKLEDHQVQPMLAFFNTVNWSNVDVEVVAYPEFFNGLMRLFTRNDQWAEIGRGLDVLLEDFILPNIKPLIHVCTQMNGEIHSTRQIAQLLKL